MGLVLDLFRLAGGADHQEAAREQSADLPAALDLGRFAVEHAVIGDRVLIIGTGAALVALHERDGIALPAAGKRGVDGLVQAHRRDARLVRRTTDVAPRLDQGRDKGHGLPAGIGEKPMPHAREALPVFVYALGHVRPPQPQRQAAGLLPADAV